MRIIILRWGLSPCSYAAGAVTVFVVPLLLILHFGGPIFGYAEMLGYSVGLLLAGPSALAWLGVGLARLERLNAAGASDHLRRCALLYALLVALGIFMVFSYVGPSCCTQFSIAAILSLLVLCAVAIDALVVYAVARGARRTEV